MSDANEANGDQDHAEKEAPKTDASRGGCRGARLNSKPALASWLINWLDAQSGVITTLATVAMVVLTYFIWRVSNGQLNILQGQQNVMTAQANIAANDQRPWISIEKINPRFISSENRFSFTLKFRNVGKTPPNGMFIYAKTTSATNWKSELTAMCDKGIAQSKNAPAAFQEGYIIPGTELFIGETPEHIYVDVSIADIEEKRLIEPRIAGCVIYGSGFDQRLHKTRFVAPLDIEGSVANIRQIDVIGPD
jgi:hypothetical protein